jgi:uncharacterized repeat protein (TIGR03803 family)
VTAYGGIGYGVVYQLSRKPHGHMWNQRVLHDFCSQPNCSDGAQPWDLASDGPGTFLGVTAVGGAFCGSANRCGTVFRMDAAGNETVLYNFCSQPDCADGSTPVSAPVADATGALIGTTFRGGGHDIDREGLGGGTIYALNGSFRTLHRFCARQACGDGDNPEGRLIADGMGHFYGVTYGGGAHGRGAVFEIVP